MRGAMSASPAAATRTASSSRSDGVSLSRNPVAPTRSALKTYSLASKVVSITTAVVFSRVGEDPLGRRQAVELGHADVHQHHVRAPAGDDVDRGIAVARLADDGDVGLGVEDHAKAGAQQPLVVGDDDRDRAQRRVLARRRRVLAVVVLAPAHERGRHRLRDALDPERARAGRISSATRGPAIWRTTSVARISPGAGGVAQAAGHDHRRPVEVAALGQRLAGVDADAHVEAVGRAGRRAAAAPPRSARPRPRWRR